MVQFNLPQNSKILKGKYYKDITAKDIINKGEIAFWVEGSSIAIGFGPTPISKNNEIRLVTNANIIGHTNTELSSLSMVNSGEIVIVERI